MLVPQERLFLDTNALFVLLSRKEGGHPPSILLQDNYSPFKGRKIRTCISETVLAEIKAIIIYKSCKPTTQADLMEKLNKLSVLKINDEIIEEYATLRSLIYKKDKNLQIKHNDLWIAATAIVKDCFIITFDTGDFAPIKSVTTKLKIHCLDMAEANLGKLKISR
jgi:predicted nucleic acid-binding protein